MMMFGLYAMERVQPFDTVALTGLIRDRYGKKMSKSSGNVVDPLDWMDAYGSDAVRFSLCRGANPGTDQAVNEEWVQGARNFCNKLWNATRFALLNGARLGELPAREQLSVTDRWILSRLHTTVAEVDGYYEGFQFARAAEALYHFAWDEVCDWYVELAKTPLARGGQDAESTRLVLGHVLDVVLRLLHPLTPFVTETLWTALTGGESVVVADWPAADPSYADAEAEAEVAVMQRLVTEVRRFRNDQGLKPGQRVPARLHTGPDGPVAAHEDEVRSLLRLERPADGFSVTASVQVGSVTVELDLSGAVDVAAERRRLDKDLAAARRELEQTTAKLGNEQFLAKAPDQVVERIRDRRATAEAEIARLEGQLAALPAAR
jgi:valyl-tRNA synthetase